MRLRKPRNYHSSTRKLFHPHLDYPHLDYHHIFETIAALVSGILKWLQVSILTVAHC
jgi:hypothetical protein